MFGWFKNNPGTCPECAKLRLDLKDLHLEFEGLQDKVYHWMKRSSARGRREMATEGPDGGPGAAAGLPGGVSPPSNVRVAALLARRAGR